MPALNARRCGCDHRLATIFSSQPAWNVHARDAYQEARSYWPVSPLDSAAIVGRPQPCG